MGKKVCLKQEKGTERRQTQRKTLLFFSIQTDTVALSFRNLQCWITPCSLSLLVSLKGHLYPRLQNCVVFLLLMLKMCLLHYRAGESTALLQQSEACLGYKGSRTLWVSGESPPTASNIYIEEFHRQTVSFYTQRYNDLQRI